MRKQYWALYANCHVCAARVECNADGEMFEHNTQTEDGDELDDVCRGSGEPAENPVEPEQLYPEDFR